MERIKLEGGTLEFHYGRHTDRVPALLARWRNSEGYIPSEADVRILGVKNFENAPAIDTHYWGTSTLSATKGNIIKVILPYPTDKPFELTESAELGLSLINPNESLVNGGVNLDIDERWEKLAGSGVYVIEREGLVLNQNLTEEQSTEHKLLLTKLGHPDYVDIEFARSKDKVAEIIGKTFEMGKNEHSYIRMMGQYLPDVNDGGILKAWYVRRLVDWSNDSGGGGLDDGTGRLGFFSPKDFTPSDKKENSEGEKSFSETVKNDADQARVQLKTLEGILKPEQIDQIGVALDERDALKRGLLTTDQIYSAIQSYVDFANEKEVRKILDNLTQR